MQIQELENCRRISLLPEHIIDQIKAGEVVERPASLLKEIIENSIDAKSTRIKIHIRNNGLDLIALEDNGLGMSVEDLPFAFCRHATSKIEKFDDLFNLASYGFRGEALASISSVARVTCSSQPAAIGQQGGTIRVAGGETIECIPYEGKGHGTSLYIKDLFFNTPARLKFIRSGQSEKIALVRIINSFLMTNPAVTFIVKWDDKDAKVYPAGDLNKRMKDIYLKKSEDPGELLSNELEFDGHRARLFCKKTGAKGGSGRKQFLFANNRLFYDKQIHQIVVKNLLSLWGHGHTGDYAVFLDIPRDKIDVNVHPNKTHLKFLKYQLVHSLIGNAVKSIVSENKQEKISEGHLNETPLPGLDALTIQENAGGIGVREWDPSKSSNLSVKAATVNRQLSNDCILFDHDPMWIVSRSRLVRAIFRKFFDSTTFPAADDEVLPLLVSEPLKGVQTPSPVLLLFMEKIGFESAIQEGIIILKSIPLFWKDIPVHEVVIPVFETVLSKKSHVPADEEQFRQLIFDSIANSKLRLSNSSIRSMVDALGENFFITSGSIFSLDEKFLDRIFP